MTEPPAPSLTIACEQLGVALRGFSAAAEEAFSATASIQSGRDVARVSAALDVLAQRVVEVQRAVASYRGLTAMAEAGWEQRQRATN